MSTSRTCAWSRLPGRTPCWTPRACWSSPAAPGTSSPGTGHDAAWWRRFLETLQDCGYDGALSIEQEDYTIPLEEALQKAVSLLRQALPA